jgi:hypothetical protein
MMGEGKLRLHKVGITPEVVAAGLPKRVKAPQQLLTVETAGMAETFPQHLVLHLVKMGLLRVVVEAGEEEIVMARVG